MLFELNEGFPDNLHKEIKKIEKNKKIIQHQFRVSRVLIPAII